MVRFPSQFGNSFPKTSTIGKSKPAKPMPYQFVREPLRFEEADELSNRAKLSTNVSPHILRHTFATLALQKGISLATLQKILGHDRLETTAIYLNLTQEHVLEEFSSKW